LSLYTALEEGGGDINLAQNSNDNDNIEHFNRARLPGNPEVNRDGHSNTYSFLIIIKN